MTTPQSYTNIGGFIYSGVSNTDSKGITVNVYSKDENGHITNCSGTSTPLYGASGYALGCFFTKTNATTRSIFINQGTTSSCDFALIVANSTSTSSSSSSSSSST